MHWLDECEHEIWGCCRKKPAPAPNDGDGCGNDDCDAYDCVVEDGKCPQNPGGEWFYECEYKGCPDPDAATWIEGD